MLQVTVRCDGLHHLDTTKSISLADAAANGRLEDVVSWLAAAPDSARYDANGETPIYLAAQNGHAEVVGVLAKAWPDDVSKRSSAAKNESTNVAAVIGNDGRTPVQCGLTPLGIAASKGHLDVVKTLLRVAPASVRDLDSIGAAAIHRAAQEGHADVVALLAAAWPESVRKKDNNGLTPLAAAAYLGHLGVVNKLLEAAPDAVRDVVPTTDATPVYLAARNGHDDVVAVLAAEWPNGVRKRTTNGKLGAIGIAAIRGHHEVAKTILKMVPDPEGNFESYAAVVQVQQEYSSHNALYKTFFRAGDAVFIALFIIVGCVFWHFSILQRRTTTAITTKPSTELAASPLSELYNEDPDQYVRRRQERGAHEPLPIYDAIEKGNRQAVEALLERYPNDSNVRTENGASLLHLAARWDRIHIIDAIHRCDPTLLRSVDNDGRLPIHIASTHNKIAYEKLKSLDPGSQYELDINGISAAMAATFTLRMTAEIDTTAHEKARPAVSSTSASITADNELQNETGEVGTTACDYHVCSYPGSEKE